MKPMLFILASLSLALAIPNAHAAMYKWVDENGVVQYTQTPPPAGTSAKKLKTRKPAVSDEQARQTLERLKDKSSTQQKDREFKKEYASAQEQRQARIKQNCETARENMRVLKTAARVRLQSEDTQDAAYLTEEQKQAKIAEAQKQIEDNCE